MSPRERVFAAISWSGPDRPPLYVLGPTPGVLCEHGSKLADLLRRHPHDFGDFAVLSVPEAPTGALDPGYCSTETDIWGVTREHRIYGASGYPKTRPLDDVRALDCYRPPPPPPMEGPDFEVLCAEAELHRQRFYLLAGFVTIFEVLHALRRCEDVLMELAEDAPHLHRIADMIVEYDDAWIRQMIAYGADGIMLADDWGTAVGPMVSPDVWRTFFRPRYQRLIAPILAAARHVFFHSCGYTEWLWEELADIGVQVFWPQLTANDNARLAEWGRRRKVTILAHPDRGRLMQYGTPDEVRAEVRRIARTFGSVEGGLIFHGEVDRGFRFANIEALYDEVFSLRYPRAAWQ